MSIFFVKSTLQPDEPKSSGFTGTLQCAISLFFSPPPFSQMICAKRPCNNGRGRGACVTDPFVSFCGKDLPRESPPGGSSIARRNRLYVGKTHQKVYTTYKTFSGNIINPHYGWGFLCCRMTGALVAATAKVVGNSRHKRAKASGRDNHLSHCCFGVLKYGIAALRPDGIVWRIALIAG